jgi:hypothetical protein
MNTFVSNGCIIDANDAHWKCDQWHLFPIPFGIVADFATDGKHVTPGRRADSTHWLVRSRLPPLPQPKSQAEMDAEAFEVEIKKWAQVSIKEKDMSRFIWNAALAYARAQKEKS